MVKYFACLLLILAVLSCTNHKGTILTTTVPKTSDSLGHNDTEAIEPTWCDTITEAYIDYLQHTHNPLLYDAAADTMYHISFMFDGTGSGIDDDDSGSGTRSYDSSSFYIMHLGYNEDLFYHTADWLYIDSITRKTYEYYSYDDTMRPIDLNKRYAVGEFQPAGYRVNGSSDHKVYFCNAPDSSTRRKAFFNTKAGVYVEKTANGYGYVEFFNSKGKASNGWIDMNDLLPYPPSADK